MLLLTEAACSEAAVALVRTKKPFNILQAYEHEGLPSNVKMYWHSTCQCTGFKPLSNDICNKLSH